MTHAGEHSRPETVSEESWSLRLTRDYAETCESRRRRNRALNRQRAHVEVALGKRDLDPSYRYPPWPGLVGGVSWPERFRSTSW